MSANSVAVFQFESQDIRFVDGKPVAKDVALGLGFKNPTDAVYRLVFPENKGVCKIQTPGGVQSITVLEEAGIYQLIFSSKLDSAKKFQQWVFKDILPSIQKTGTFGFDVPKTYGEALAEAAQFALEKEKLEKEQRLLKAELKIVEEANEQLTVIADEVYNFSSIIRIAKFNNVHESAFTWRRLKAGSQELGYEIKKAPCPRYGSKNLYHNDVWAYCYPDINLPPSTWDVKTLTVAN